jgi:predicted urease superfamily metal-dependent hydrolase
MLLSDGRRRGERCGCQTVRLRASARVAAHIGDHPAEVARFAEAFGHEDDIRVIAVTRDAVREPEPRPVFA